MTGTFRFELVSPESLLLSEAVEEVILPGSEGYLTVMASHAPMMIRVIPGVVRVKVAGKEDRVFVVFGGFVDITPEVCSLLAESIISMEALNLQDIEYRITEARAEFEAAKTDEYRNKAEEFLYQLTTVKGVYALV